jgi:hypothetical protein
MIIQYFSQDLSLKKSLRGGYEIKDVTVTLYRDEGTGITCDTVMVGHFMKCIVEKKRYGL